MWRGLDLAKSAADADFGPPASAAMIEEAETYLKLRFPRSYREFLAAAGCGSFAGREIYGIVPDGLAATAIPSVTFATSRKRSRGLPQRFVLIEDPGTEEECVLDTQDLTPDGEGRVKVWIPGSDPNHLEVIATDFGTYLLKAAEEATS